MAKLDYYDCLGLTQDATQAEIKRAFRRMVRVNHPDLNPGDPKAAERLKEIVSAFDTLGDTDRRSRYDRINNLFGPRLRSREDVVEEKSFFATSRPYAGQVYLNSVVSRRAQARAGAIFFLILLAVVCGVILWGVMSDGFARSPFQYVPRWRVTEQPLPGPGVFVSEPVGVGWSAPSTASRRLHREIQGKRHAGMNSN
jgi:curved DNA-binding protein CbpA